MNVGGSWACRDIPGVGDSLGEERCGSGDLSLQKYDGNLNPDHPTFKRMVDYLQSQGIDVTVWDGEKPVFLEKWLEERARKKN
jgi:hypothetical protein